MLVQVGQGLTLPSTSAHPVTISGCDGLLASGVQGEVFLNAVLATPERCWVTLHIAVKQTEAYDAFHDLQTWNEDSLAEYRFAGSDAYDIRLTIDGKPVPLALARGNGGGIDDETGQVRWTQPLTFPLAVGQQSGLLELRWEALRLSGRHQLDLVHIADAVAHGAF